jgi:hypothetical protein
VLIVQHTPAADYDPQQEDWFPVHNLPRRGPSGTYGRFPTFRSGRQTEPVRQTTASGILSCIIDYAEIAVGSLLKCRPVSGELHKGALPCYGRRGIIDGRALEWAPSEELLYRQEPKAYV